MPIQSTETSKVLVDQANQQWIIKRGVVVDAVDNNAVEITKAGGRLINHGDLTATGDIFFNGNGVWGQNSAPGAFVFNDGSILATTGVKLSASNGNVVNDGSITGQGKSGVVFDSFTANQQLHNEGYIFGHTAGVTADTVSTKVSIFNAGIIESDGIGISGNIRPDTLLAIENSGTIRGSDFAILSDAFGAVSLKNTGDIFGTVKITTGDSDKVVNGGIIQGDVLFGFGKDTYDGRGGAVEGLVSGGSGADKLSGGSHSDDFSGGAGEDVLQGRGGDDVLEGGDRADRLKGGGGEDLFVYRNLGDSQGGFFADTARDTIIDFRHSDGDRIDLHLIDANGKTAEENKFKFIGTEAFNHVRGELRYHVEHGDAFVQGDATGDGKADFEIQVADVSLLSAGDFVL